MELEQSLQNNYTQISELKKDLEKLYPNLNQQELQIVLNQQWKLRKTYTDNKVEDDQKCKSEQLTQPKKISSKTKTDDKKKKKSLYEVNKKWFIQENKGQIDQFYEMNQKISLGQGGFATTYKVKRKNIEEYRAIKILSKSYVTKNSLNKTQFTQEVTNMKNLDHPNVIRLYEIFEDRLFIYLVMELCEGGEVFDKIVQHKHFTEQKAKKTFKQIAEAIHYCHLNNISHGDLKPENLMYLNSQDDSPIKVIDFGFSADKTNIDNPICGTGYYMSPELKAYKQDPLADVWAMGIILFIMLCGVPPLVRKDCENGKKKWIFSLNFDQRPQFNNVSQEAKDLIKNCLRPSQHRFTTAQIIQSNWLQQLKTEEQEQHQKNLQMLEIDKLKIFTKSNSLRKVILTHIATLLTEKDILELQNLFKSLDTNQDGLISFEELKSGFQQKSNNVLHNSQTWKQLQDIFNNIDTDSSGQLDYTEFIAASLEQSYYLEEDRLHLIFQEIDANKDGYLSLQEIYNYLQKSTTIVEQQNNSQNLSQNQEEAKDLLDSEHNLDKNQQYFEIIKNEMKEADQNSDGKIDFQEFIQMMKPNTNLLMSSQNITHAQITNSQFTNEQQQQNINKTHSTNTTIQEKMQNLQEFYSQDKELSQIFEKFSRTQSQLEQQTSKQYQQKQQHQQELGIIQEEGQIQQKQLQQE